MEYKFYLNLLYMTKSGGALNNLIDIFQGQQPVVNNGKAYSAIDAGFRQLIKDEISGCNSCFHKCGANLCAIVDAPITEFTRCNFQVGSSQSKSRGNNITMDIEDLFKS